MPVRKRIIFVFGARAERIRLVLFAVAVVLCGWSLSSSATVTGGGRMGQISWDYERMMNQTIRSLNSPAGIAMDSNGIARIGYAGKRIGQIAITETATIGIADMAAVAARSVNPAMIAIMVGTLAVEGLSRCLQSNTGWCKRGQANPSASDVGFDGWSWNGKAGALFPSPLQACVSLTPEGNVSFNSIQDAGDGSYNCLFNNLNSGGMFLYGRTVRSGQCVASYVLSGSACVVDPNVKVDPVPVTYPDIAAAWNRQMAANPTGLPDYWHAMTPDEQAQAASNAQNQTPQINGTDTVSDPSAKTSTDTQTKPDGTSETCTTTTGVRVQARPNTSATSGDSPLNYQGTTTTTRSCPSTGTTTTTNGQDSGDTGTRTGGGPASGVSTGGGTPPKVELKTCGLADTGPCKIDESGTPTVVDGKAAVAAAQSDLTQARQDAETNFTSVNAGRVFDLHMPHLLPGGTCQPVEWFSWGSWRGSWDPCDSMAYVRTLLSWLWYTLAAIYIWNRTASANAGAQ